ncbi:hypothetical protein EMIT0324P_70250 [Pseudomonas chlororaphis]
MYDSGTIQEAACWAHARRKFYDVYKDQASPLAALALQRIAALYACCVRCYISTSRRRDLVDFRTIIA